MDFKYNYNIYPSERRAVFAKNGMVASSNSLATSSGLDILRRGGNAIDAALAVASTMTVTEPIGNGLGSDMFAITWYEGKMYGINASGRSPKMVSIDELKKLGYDKMPSYGIHSINTPGAVGGWMAMHEKFASFELEEIFKSAIEYARSGYPVSPKIAEIWNKEVKKYSKFIEKSEFNGFFDEFTIDGKAPRPSEIFKNENLADTLESIAKTKGESFYSGEYADKIDKFMRENGGFLRKEDLKNYSPIWIEPITTNYKGIDVWEMPPNGHGITVLMALNILEELKLTHREDPETAHKIIEAIKLAMVDTDTFITDPDFMNVSVKDLLSRDYAKKRSEDIRELATVKKAGEFSSSTVYFAVADKDGNMVSMIQSNYHGFGSGIVIPGTGITLNNRLENFKFEKEHVNSLMPSKLPYHTIIPGFLTKDGKALGCFGIMGGFMQPQAHVQVLTNLIDFKLNPQQALDAPRFMWVGENNIEIEKDYPRFLINALKDMGHNIKICSDYTSMGRGEIILRNEDGVYIGATEKRTDGSVLGY